jgi:hypothetical protein
MIALGRQYSNNLAIGSMIAKNHAVIAERGGGTYA